MAICNKIRYDSEPQVEWHGYCILCAQIESLNAALCVIP